MRSFEVKPANRQEIDAITQEAFSSTAFVFKVTEEETILGFIGFYRKHNYLVLFSYIRPFIYKQLKRYRRAFVIGYRHVMKVLKNYPFPVYSGADPDIEGSDRLLKHLGFEHVTGVTYVWHGPH